MLLLTGPVSQSARDKEAAPGAANGSKHRLCPNHPEIAFILTGEACGRGIFARSGTAHRNRQAHITVTETKFVIRVTQRAFQRALHRRPLDELTHAKRRHLERDEIVGIGRRLQFALHSPTELIPGQKSFERGGGDRKAVRHFDAACPQRSQSSDLGAYFRIVLVGQLT